MTKTPIEQEIQRLYLEHANCGVPGYERGWHAVAEVPKSRLLIVGLNPSFDEKRAVFKNEAITYPLPVEDPSGGYWHGVMNFVNSVFKETDAAEVNNKFAHLDVMLHRETSSAVLGKLVAHKDDLFSEYFMAQFKLFADRLNEWHAQQPDTTKVVLVTSTLARDFMLGWGKMKEYMGIYNSLEWNLDKCCQKVASEGHDLSGLYFMFSGMLSGHHQIDKGSKERMAYQIRRILDL